MDRNTIPLPRTSPLEGVLRQGRFGAGLEGGPGVILGIDHPVSIVTVIARKGKAAELSETFSHHFGVACPPPGHSSESNSGLVLHWCGSEQWYATGRGWAEGALLSDLAEHSGGLASLSDQSHGRVIFRVAGPKAAAMLAKGTPVDLHPRAFGPGRSAVTQMAHVGVHLAQVGEQSYELSVFRGFSESFWEWLCEMSQEYGYAVR